MDIAGGSSSELARTGILVENVGIDEARAELLGLADTADAAGKRAGTAASAGANQFSQSFVDASRQAQTAAREMADVQARESARGAEAARQAQERSAAGQRAAAQAAARESATAAAQEIERIFAAESARIKEGMARGFITPAEAREAGREAAQAYNQALLAQLDRLGQAGLSGTNSKTFIDLSNALKTIPAPLKEVGDGAVRTGVTLNTLRSGVTALAASTLQSAPGVAQLGSSILAMSLGTLTTLGVMAGIAAVSYGWQKWSEDARKAREDQDKLTDALAKWYETQRNGEAGARQLQVRATESRIAEEESRLTLLRGRLDSPTVNRSEGTAAAIEKEIAQVEAALRRDRAAIAAGNADIIRTISEGDVQRRNAEASSLASLIAGHQATEAERARALRVLQEQQALLVAYSKPPAGATDEIRRFFLEQRAAIAESAKALQDAITGKPDRVTASPESPERQKVINDLSAQLDALRKLNAESAIAEQRARDQIILLGSEGLARDLLANRIKAQEQAQAAQRDHAGQGLILREALEGIEAERRANDERAITKQRLADVLAAQKLVTDAVKQAGEVAERNAKVTHASLEEGAKLYQQTEHEARNLSSTIERDLVQSIVQFGARGTQSFTGFLTVVEQGALRMTQAVERSIDRQNELYEEARRKNQSADAAVIAERIRQLEEYRRALAFVGTVSSAGLAGYNFGQQAGSTANGVVGGAVTGAIQGGQLLGAPGAVVGGLVGAAAGLLGAADAHKAAARAIEDANRAIQHSLAGFGQQNSVASSLLNNTVQADAIRNAINDNLRAALKNGGGEEAFRTAYDQLTKLDREQKDNALRIAQNFWDGIAQGLHSLQGPSGDFQNQLDALRKQYEDNKAAAEALGGSTESVTELYNAQVAALKAAFEEVERRRQEDLSVRRLTATGGTTRAIDDAQFAISQRREIADLQSQHQPQDLIDQVLAIQDLERKYREEQRALINQQAQEDYRVRELQASGRSEEAAALRLQLDQQREYQAAVKAGLDDATLAALALAQAAEGAAAAAKQAQDAQRALDDLQVRALTAQGNTGAADALRFQLQQQRELEDAIAAGRNQEYIDKLKAVQQLEAQARAAGQQTVNNTAVARDVQASEAVSYAARNLSEITGNRMADYLASIQALEREQLQLWQRYLGAIPSFAQPIGYNANTGVQPSSVAGIDVNQIAALLSNRAAPATPTSGGTRDINLRLTVDVRASRAGVKATASDEELDDLVDRIKGKLRDALVHDEDLQRLADGSPLIAGR